MKSLTTYHISPNHHIKKYRWLEISKYDFDQVNFYSKEEKRFNDNYARNNHHHLITEDIGYPVPLRGFGISALLRDFEVVAVTHSEPVEVTALEGVHGGFGRCSLFWRIIVFLYQGKWFKKIK